MEYELVNEVLNRKNTYSEWRIVKQSLQHYNNRKMDILEIAYKLTPEQKDFKKRIMCIELIPLSICSLSFLCILYILFSPLNILFLWVYKHFGEQYNASALLPLKVLLHSGRLHILSFFIISFN
jgi:hypothetical protein